MKDVIRNENLKKAINNSLGRGWSNDPVSSRDMEQILEILRCQTRQCIVNFPPPTITRR